jgi:N-acetylneuraminic acid mutarotase
MKLLLKILFTLVIVPAFSQQWNVVQATGSFEKRGESGVATVNGKLYLLGGRGDKPVNEYDPKTNSWTALANAPLEIHHFQAISFKDEIYVIGAFTGPYPHETPIPNIYVFNPKKNEWRKGPEIPEGRRRGAAGAFVYKNKIYVVCGEQDGHWDGHVAWFDVYDPATGKWTQLPDAPRPRDHVQVGVVDNKLVVAGGRLSTARTNNVLNTTVKETDVFDFKSEKWTTLDPSNNIPTLRAGSAAVIYNGQVVLMGGESDAHVEAHNEMEGFNVKTNKWQKFPNLLQGRHGTGGVVLNGKIYLVGGVGNRGGGPELSELEEYR